MPSKQELLEKCKELKLKSCTGKNKDELIKILEDSGYVFGKQEYIEIEEIEINPFNSVINQLCQLIKKDTRRKVCPNCHELGHDKASDKCLYNVDLDNKNREKIRQIILKNENDNDEKIAEELGISIGKYRSLYNEIPLDEILVAQEITEEDMIQTLTRSSYECALCNKKQFNPYISGREWKEHKHICDICWLNFDKEREIIWNEIMEYTKKKNCNICNITKIHSTQRFHYDHINMFDKSDTIYNMVNKGCEISLIKEELEKCQLVCISCHSMITKIENKFIFTKIKSKLTRQLRRKQITEEEYNVECIKYNKIYEDKMTKIYSMIRENIYSK
jgi:hypothetical protein